MGDLANNELAARIDAVGHALLLLTAELERNGRIDGIRYSQSLRRFGRDRGTHPGLARCGAVLQELATRLDEARTRRSAGRRD